MDSINYRIYEIDVTDILGYESGWYDLKKRDKTSVNELHEFLFNSFLSKYGSIAKTGPAGLSNYERALRAKSREKNDLDECWAYLYKVYMSRLKNPNYTLQLNDENQLLFQKLFVFKINQYENGLIYIDNFLNYQCKTNFRNDAARLWEFFDKCLLQYKSIKAAIVQAVDHWVKDTEKKKMNLEETETVLFDSQQSKSNDVKTNIDQSAPMEVAPEDYEVIDGKFTPQEIIEFFSFLHKEKSKEGVSFLTEDEVAEIFKYGLAIPPPGTVLKRYTLTYNDAFPKKIVEYCIHRFTKLHTSIRKKKEVLRFFGSYLTDYSRALSDENYMTNSCNNIRGKRSRRMKFVPNTYLPVRMRSSKDK